MNTDKSLAALTKFLDYMANKGLSPATTISARKAAVNKVLGILEPDESADVNSIDLNDVMIRFGNLHGQGYTPESLTTYKSRVRSALDDFSDYLENPLGFRPNKPVRERAAKPANGSPVKMKQEAGLDSTRVSRAPERRPSPISDSILPIPIRADLTVYIQGLPFNLTKTEASKISAVVLAMAASDENF